MAKKKEKVVEEITEQPIVDDTVEKIKVKKKSTMKKLSQDNDGVIKVDLNNPPKENVNEQPVGNMEAKEVQETVTEQITDKEEVVEQSTQENTETPVLEEINGFYE